MPWQLATLLAQHAIRLRLADNQVRYVMDGSIAPTLHPCALWGTRCLCLSVPNLQQLATIREQVDVAVRPLLDITYPFSKLCKQALTGYRLIA